MSVPVNVLVFALLMLSLSRCGARMKYLVLYLPVWSMSGRCSGRFVMVQRIGKGELEASGELTKSQTSVIGLL
ncbi:hypothetical protein DPMN_000388 [Dreissena polymorpha]|uniref:Secreted protein n=1 Tax=Dreissena polymorpha TaxID=45954 RepID=A0A9D4MGL1_DREPO|nr:hypothetical protein DPMN_000388 [Dreissena polymorpha]